MPSSEDILGFFGDYRFLSNFWYCTIEFEGEKYRTTEHAYQAAKTLDPKERKVIQEETHPAGARRKGQVLKLRDDWEEVKLKLMLEFTRQKFKNNDILAKKLLDTGDSYLEETNTWGDKFWGVCRGIGENNLGNILMKVRDELRQE